jgi:Ni/Co efflux regulator RcnB
MKTRWVVTIIAAALMIFVGSVAFSQDKNDDKHWDKDHPTFNAHEHEVVQTWWTEHRDHPGTGFRAEDRLPADWEPLLKPGFVLNEEWRHKLHIIPPSLGFHLRRPPMPYLVHVIGGHIVLVNHDDWHVADVINLNN